MASAARALWGWSRNATGLTRARSYAFVIGFNAGKCATSENIENPSSRKSNHVSDPIPPGEVEDKFAAAGFPVFSNAKNHRYDPDVPILIPHANASHLDVVAHQVGRSCRGSRSVHNRVVAALFFRSSSCVEKPLPNPSLSLWFSSFYFLPRLPSDLLFH